MASLLSALSTPGIATRRIPGAPVRSRNGRMVPSGHGDRKQEPERLNDPVARPRRHEVTDGPDPLPSSPRPSKRTASRRASRARRTPRFRTGRTGTRSRPRDRSAPRARWRGGALWVSRAGAGSPPPCAGPHPRPSTTQLAALTGLPLGAVSNHLRVLLEAGAVPGRRAGRAVVFWRPSLRPAPPAPRRCHYTPERAPRL